MASRNTKKICCLLAIVILIMTIIGTPRSPQGSSTAYATNQTPSGADDNQTRLQPAALPDRTEPFYYEVRQVWEKEGVPSGTVTMDIPAGKWARKSDDALLGSYQGESGTLTFAKSKGWVEYKVNVEREGLYELDATYVPVVAEDSGGLQRIMLAIQVNGEYPYAEAHSMTLERSFRDRKPDKFDEDGNQMRSLIEETTVWSTKPLKDIEGAYAQAPLWHFKKGLNTIRIEALMQPLALKSLTLKPQEAVPAYQEVKQTVSAPAAGHGAVIEIEAEQFSAKNSSSIQVQYNRDPLTMPASPKTIRFNTMGGWSWYKGGQAVTWEFDVPEDGLYQLGMRANQNFRSNLSVFRTVTIDGKVPFRELLRYPFPYHSGWGGVTLQDEEGSPYEFYLSKGHHTLGLEANYEPYMPLLVQMDHMLDEFRAVSTDIRTATGNREDRYRVWDVEKDIPGLTDRLQALQQQLTQLSERMTGINGKRDSVSQSFLSSAKDLGDLLDHPDAIPSSQLTIGTLQEKLINQRKDLMDSPLELDRIVITAAGSEFPRMKANWWEKSKGLVSSLLYSFDDRNSISRSRKDNEINVWMFWGRDYVNELQQLADEKFTPKSGVKVKINLVQSSDLLILGNAAGIVPDVALGVPSGMPFELAVRHAAYDLSKLPGGEELLQRYSPGTLQPYYYDGGYYGVPETMNFKVLFYRKDILKQLGLSVPDTWNDVYEMLPTLLQNEYNFYVDPADFSYLFLQNGADLYTPDGLATGLDKPEAFDAFKRWTDLFNMHGLERQVQSFYNQFRKGTIPIGISDFNQYMQLLVAAPEIMEDWAIAPVPGTVEKDGTVSRWIGGSQSVSSMMFKAASEKKRDHAWEFLQWYLSAETQTEFGLNLEQYNGETFRWNSANAKAFANMPWNPDDLNVFLDQWQWMKEFPNVPGGYMSGRELGFAWNRAVIDGETPRVSLEKAVREINRELVRKQREFHIVDDNGKVLKPLKLPQPMEPWKGAERYVK
ncbi:extracellular solute-binding protein [Paenibacillus nasutitermitis]|uniref:ABC transporter substrate-binding protein n=1 Tax=Paenibacillus nasutitermitis TaxID=1652958 RepID=A0A916YYS0_9BACL|nr:extracellular solute-binding protein [Paenibacillus nasutitermitis]GGD66256.1 ABC transporter substrate-binding protein [Paenibacillus nasutitermitis]